jgi:hypothetical protein
VLNPVLSEKTVFKITERAPHPALESAERALVEALAISQSVDEIKAVTSVPGLRSKTPEPSP